MSIPAGTIRVFPRRTKATPTDTCVIVGPPPLFIDTTSVRAVHVSCTFTWDKPEAERLLVAWHFGCPAAEILIGGPAYDAVGCDFDPGMYLKPGYTITSRGCPNRCPQCLVPRREGPLRTIPIRDGWDVLDNNLLACPEDHIDAVLAMLRCQPDRPRFTGGFEARRMTPELAREILATKPDRFYFAYDRPGQLEDVAKATAVITEASGWSRGRLRHYVGCYILVGYPESDEGPADTIAAAEGRISKIIALGLRAFPMYYRDKTYTARPREWHDLVGGVLAMGGAT